ncbi:MAG: hypothetical protein V1911_02820 [Candidatus Micrarchaeota archaeon]
MNKRKAQLSLELLILMAACLSFFALILPQIRAASDAGFSRLAEQDRESLSLRLSQACERALITGAGQEIEARSLSAFNFSLEKCTASANITAGGNVIYVMPKMREG